MSGEFVSDPIMRKDVLPGKKQESFFAELRVSLVIYLLKSMEPKTPLFLILCPLLTLFVCVVKSFAEKHTMLISEGAETAPFCLFRKGISFYPHLKYGTVRSIPLMLSALVQHA